MTGLELLALGVGDAFSARWYSSCLLLRCGEAHLLVDCPHPIRKMLAEAKAGVDVGDVLAVALTHLHADHSSGLEGFGYFCRFVLGRRARLVAHPAVLARLWEGHLAAGMEQLIDDPGSPPRSLELADYFELTPLVDSVTIGPFRIESRLTVHHVPTTALRITAGGRCLGYSADTAFDPSLIEWLSSADSIVHETNYGVHTPYARLAELPEALRARMRLIHYPDDFSAESSVIRVLEQGEVLSV